jgi:hypothetical protein
MEERATRFDFSDEYAGSREGVQAGEFQGERREGEFGEFTFDVWERRFGDLSEEDQSEVEVFGRGSASFG